MEVVLIDIAIRSAGKDQTFSAGPDPFRDLLLDGRVFRSRKFKGLKERVRGGLMEHLQDRPRSETNIAKEGRNHDA